MELPAQCEFYIIYCSGTSDPPVDISSSNRFNDWEIYDIHLSADDDQKQNYEEALFAMFHFLEHIEMIAVSPKKLFE